MRLLAAFLVIVGHCYELVNRAVLGIKGDPFAYLTNTDTLGATGVVMFFALSGYLVTQSMQRSDNVLHFLWKRLLRLMPALIACVTVLVLVWGALLTSLSALEYFGNPKTWNYFRVLYFNLKEPLPGVFVDNPLNMAINGSLWSLGIEARCYLLLALLMLLPSRWRTWAYPIFLVLIIAMMVRHFNKGDFVVRFFKQESALTIKLCIPFFVAGAIALYRLEHLLSIKVGLVLVCFALYLGKFHDPGFRWAWSVYSFSICYLCLSVALNTSGWLSALTERGDYSYGLYLWAYPVQQTLLHFDRTMNMALYLVLCITITFGLAMLSWHWVEKPSKQWKFPKLIF